MLALTKNNSTLLLILMNSVHKFKEISRMPAVEEIFKLNPEATNSKPKSSNKKLTVKSLDQSRKKSLLKTMKQLFALDVMALKLTKEDFLAENAMVLVLLTANSSMNLSRL